MQGGFLCQFSPGLIDYSLSPQYHTIHSTLTCRDIESLTGLLCRVTLRLQRYDWTVAVQESSISLVERVTYVSDSPAFEEFFPLSKYKC